MFELRKQTILASNKSNKSKTNIKVGLDVSPKINLVPESNDQLMIMLHDSIHQLWNEIQLDACVETYTDACAGTDKDVDALTKKIKDHADSGGVKDAKTILELAGIPPTADNQKKFATCIQARKNPTGAVPTGTLAWCALFVDRGTSDKAHTKLSWRTEYETWKNNWLTFRSKINDSLTGSASTDEIEPYRRKYNNYRKQFITQGGKTETQEISGAGSISKTIIYIIGGVVILFIGVQLIGVYSTYRMATK